MGNLSTIPRTGTRCAALRDMRVGAGLAVILPGYRYTCDQPLLLGTTSLLKSRGWRVLELQFRYNTDAEFRVASTEDKIETLETDGAAILTHALNLAPDGPHLFVGKSLGTISIGGMVRAGLPPRAGLVWLTPTLAGTPLMARMQAAGRRAFSLIGTEDPAYTTAHSPAFHAIPNLTHVEVAGMDHTWHHHEGDQASEAGLDTAIQALSGWLD